MSDNNPPTKKTSKQSILMFIGWLIALSLLSNFVLGKTEQSKTDQTTDPVVEQPAEQQVEEKQPSASTIRAVFVDACLEQGEVTKTTCECLYNRMEQEHGSQGVLAISRDKEKSEAAVLDASLACMDTV